MILYRCERYDFRYDIISIRYFIDSIRYFIDSILLCQLDIFQFDYFFGSPGIIQKRCLVLEKRHTIL